MGWLNAKRSSGSRHVTRRLRELITRGEAACPDQPTMIIVNAQPKNASSDPASCGLKDMCVHAFTEKFLALFGATSFHPLKMQMSAGAERQHDGEIERAVLRRLGAREPQAVLEIGAGRSYPQQSQCQGVPYLSRKLAGITCESGMSILCSDLIGMHEKVVFFLHRGGVLSTAGQTVVDASLPVSELVTQGRVVTIAPLSSEASKTPMLTGLAESAKAVCRSEIERVFVRPALDPELERVAFGLTCVPQVDFCALGQFADNSMDVVFARHVNPYISQTGSLPRVMKACERVLRNGGEALLHVDGEPLLIGEKRDNQTLWRRQER